MCGLFGFTSNDGQGPDIEIVKKTADHAAERGFHGYGFTYLKGNKLHTVKDTSNLQDSLSSLEVAEGAQAIIGNCRLATFGGHDAINDTQPIHNGRLAIVHNGNVYQYEDIYKDFRYTPKTKSDSEALFMLYQRRLQSKINDLVTSPYAILVINGSNFEALSRGLPLFRLYRKEGTYYCSKKFHPESELISPIEKSM